MLTDSERTKSYPDFERPFILHIDASQDGLGAVLYQEPGKQLKVVSFGSRTLTLSEQNYRLHSGKLELLALYWSVREIERLPLLCTIFHRFQ